MKNTLFALAILAASAFGQTALTSTTLTNAITVNQQTFSVAATTGMTVGTTRLYIIDKGGQGRGELTGLVSLSIESLPITDSGLEQLKTLTATWYPYAGFVYFHLLLAKLHAKGLV